MHFTRPAAALLLCALAAACGRSLPGEIERGAAAPGGDEAGLANAGGTPNFPTKLIEQKYYADGPWRVTAQAGFACCDSSGNKYDIWYPAELGSNGFLHPVITWGDGSYATPDQYDYFLRHLATWGFIVIASETQTAHTGQEMIDAAQYVVTQNEVQGGPFYHHVAVSQVGAMGHSQGSGGAVLALMNSGGFIKTAVPIEHPEQTECSAGDCPSMAEIKSGSVFFINGSADTGISPSTQADSCTKNGAPNEQSDACFYAATPDTVQKAWGTIIGPNHNDVQGQPDCASESLGSQLTCANGVYGYLGYPTAWMMDQLQGAADAHSVFVAGSGEFFSEKQNWQNQVSNIP